jgi:hypothetical protein
MELDLGAAIFLLPGLWAGIQYLTIVFTRKYGGRSPRIF